jgi:hypothetical protein
MPVLSSSTSLTAPSGSTISCARHVRAKNGRESLSLMQQNLNPAVEINNFVEVMVTESNKWLSKVAP